MREALLRSIYRLFPFDLRGDCPVPPARDGIRLSCVINFYGRLDLLAGILHSLAQQELPRAEFEVVLVEDRAGTEAGKRMAEEFADRLPIVYAPLDKNFGSMGYSRNHGVAASRGEYLLFLDDDTVLLQPDFLSTLLDEFAAHPEAAAVVPRGEASYALVEGRYHHHDEFFMTSRCTAYRRDIIARLGGFMSAFIGQEDVEFVVRFLVAGAKSVNSPRLQYYHPPLLVGNFRKPMAVGQSFYRLKGRYSWPLWLLVLANCSRHAPLYLLPGRKNREMGRFGLGFIAGVISSLFRKKEFQYG
ncbi:glycosyltransferase family 2 protein [Geomonas sp. Red32]|uniref:glycosyltransferase family A protein n=1 Tax=Geomonas sp. Red32 TaxID=2912856 RepID=UPI00202CD623|nr:glycosyltransferase family A protein [Geomonas sp. Red32]MCM0083476.1 glycosyltransferase family 2 protein [Geomonas sp. Red32]